MYLSVVNAGFFGKKIIQVAGDVRSFGIQQNPMFKKSAYTIRPGQIIATSHDLTPKGSLVREIPLFQENPGW